MQLHDCHALKSARTELSCSRSPGPAAAPSAALPRRPSYVQVRAHEHDLAVKVGLAEVANALLGHGGNHAGAGSLRGQGRRKAERGLVRECGERPLRTTIECPDLNVAFSTELLIVRSRIAAAVLRAVATVGSPSLSPDLHAVHTLHHGAAEAGLCGLAAKAASGSESSLLGRRASSSGHRGARDGSCSDGGGHCVLSRLAERPMAAPFCDLATVSSWNDPRNARG